MLRSGRSARGSALGLVLALAFAACAPAPAAQPQPAASPPPPANTSRAPSAPAASTGRSDALQAMVNAARAEGQLNLVWNPGTIGTAEDIQRLAEGFNKYYGLNLNVQFTPGPAMPQMAVRTIQELQAGRPASTDVYIGVETHIVTMMQADALEPVDWASWAANVRDGRLLAPGGVAVQIATRVPGISYNTQRVASNEVPQSLQDLLKPQYKGRVASTPYAGNFDVLAAPEMWGEQAAVDYVTKLADQVGGLIRCGEYERLASGEVDLFAIDCDSFYTKKMQSQGAPLGYVVPADAALLLYHYMGVPRNAPHPNAARLWIDYMLSREAQDMLYASDAVDHHLLPGSHNAAEIERLRASGVKFLELDVAFAQRYDEKERGRMQAELQRLLQKR